MNQILPTTFSAAFKAFFVVQNTVPSALLTAIRFSIVNLFHLFSFTSTKEKQPEGVPSCIQVWPAAAFAASYIKLLLEASTFLMLPSFFININVMIDSCAAILAKSIGFIFCPPKFNVNTISFSYDIKILIILIFAKFLQKFFTLFGRLCSIMGILS